MNICLFSEEEISNPLPLKDERSSHLLKVLHKTVGDTFTAGIINGKSGKATITEISDCIKFTFEPDNNSKPLSNLTMIIGFPRPIQLKRLLRDIAGIGVKSVHLTGTELGEKSYLKSDLAQKPNAYKMLLDGTIQAGSTYVPELFLHNTLTECLEYIESNSCATNYFALDNVKPSKSLHEATKNLTKSDTIVAAIGSERGWTDKERNLLLKYNYVLCSMGQRILRTETAATVAGSIILSDTNFLN